MKKFLTATALMLSLATASGIALAEHHEGRPHDGPPPHVQEALAKLPADKAKQVGDTLHSLRESRKADWESFKAHHQAMRAMLTAESFDKAAYMAKAKELDALHSAKKLNYHATIADLAAELSPEERKILAEAMPGKHHWRHHGKKHDGGGKSGQGQ